MMVASSVVSAAEAVDHTALAEATPLDEIDVSDPKLYQQDVWQPYFRRLRRRRRSTIAGKVRLGRSGR